MKTVTLLIPAIVVMLGLALLIDVSRAKGPASTLRERIVKTAKTQSGIIFMLTGSFTLYQVYAGEIIGPSAALGALLLICLFLLPVGLLTGAGTVLFANWADSRKSKFHSSRKE